MLRLLPVLLLAVLMGGCSAAGESKTPTPVTGDPPKPGDGKDGNGPLPDPVEEEKAAKFVISRGGKVERDEKQPGKPVVTVYLSGSSRIVGKGRWEQGIKDDDVKKLAPFTQLATLHLIQTEVTEVGLRELSIFRRLTALDLAGTGVSQKGVEEVAKLKSLTSLDLVSGGVTTAGLRELAKLPNLTALRMECVLDNAWIKELVKLQKLTSLQLRFPPAAGSLTPDGEFASAMNAANIKMFATFKNLTGLDFSGSELTDEGLREVAKLKSLTSLGLAGTEVRDAQLKELVPLSNLTKLDLAFCPLLTDAGMKELTALKTLVNLNVSATKVTDSGVKELQTVLPNCKITTK
jgi:internalin A